MPLLGDINSEIISPTLFTIQQLILGQSEYLLKSKFMEVLMQKQYLSIEEASQLSGLSKWYLYKLSGKRELPMLKVSNRCLLPMEEFRSWLEKHRIDNTGGEK